MPSRFLKSLMSLIILLMLFATSIDAQPTDVSSRQSIEIVKGQLEFLKDINKQYPNNRVNDLIQKIEVLITKAIHALDNKQFRLAAQEIQTAKILIDRAMTLVFRGPITILKQELEDKIRMVKNVLQSNFNQKAQRFLQLAQKNKNEADGAVKRQNIEKAVGFYHVAKFNIDKAWDLLSWAGGDKLYTSYLEAKANYEQLINRIQGLLVGDRKFDLSNSKDQKLCRELYKQALNQQKQAVAAFNRRELKRAIEHYGWGTRLTLRAIDVCKPPSITAALHNLKQAAFEELQQVKELMNSVGRSLHENPISQQNKLYRQAQQVYSDASRSYDAGDYSQAVQKVRLAKRIVSKISKLSGKEDVNIRNRFEQELDLFSNLLRKIELQVQNSQNQYFENILINARRFLVESQHAYANGNKILATAKLFTATKFVLSVKTQLSNNAQVDNLRIEAGTAFARFEQKHRELQTQFGNSTDPFTLAWFALETEIYQLTLNEKNSEKYEMVLEISRVGLQLIDRIEKHQKQ